MQNQAYLQISGSNTKKANHVKKIISMPAKLLFTLLSIIPFSALSAEDPGIRHTAVFPREKGIHNHAPCVTECPNGDLLLAYYTGHGERSSDDVRIVGHRLVKGQKEWSPRMELADTPGYPDCNPALFAAPNGELWLWYPTILDHHWEGALLKYHVSNDFQTAGKAPAWSREGVAHVTPTGFEKHFADAVKRQKADAVAKMVPRWNKILEVTTDRSKQELYQRLGWMPRVRPMVLSSGRWLLPLYTDTYSAGLAYYTDDQGKSWKTSEPMIGLGNIQPAFVERKDGTVVSYMRDNGPFERIRVAESKDGGHSWSAVTSSPLPNPGAGVDCIKLQSGAWLMIYNDLTDGRWSLALSLSDDEGRTWPVTRHVVRNEKKQGSYHYPSLLQSKDGKIHVLYTDGGIPEGSTMTHAETTEAWVRGGHPTPSPKPNAFNTIGLLTEKPATADQK
jgi:predicted neuraminidase